MDDSLALTPFLPAVGGDEGAVMTSLLESLTRMVSRNHRPSSCLLARLTDGRVKIVASPEGSRQAREEALRVRNEHGPLSLAFSIEVEDGPGGVRFVIENLGRRGPARMEHRCGPQGRDLRQEAGKKWGLSQAPNQNYPERKYPLERGGLSPDFFAASNQPRW